MSGLGYPRFHTPSMLRALDHREMRLAEAIEFASTFFSPRRKNLNLGVHPDPRCVGPSL
jgi:hypothetical protein